MFSLFFFFKQKTAYEFSLGLVGSEMCIRDRTTRVSRERLFFFETRFLCIVLAVLELTL